MKALVKTKPAPGASYIDVPEPEVGPNSVLIQVKATSFCGTDLQIYKWSDWAAGRIKTPLVFGHEITGEVMEVGSHVRKVQVGDHVSAESHIPCQYCHQCLTGDMHICQNLEILGVDRPGGFAEYLEIPEICAVKNDKSMPWELASMQEPFGNSVYVVTEAEVEGRTVAIFGDGPTGMYATAVARAYGATKIFCVGMQEYRMNILKQYDPDVIIDAGKACASEIILEATKGLGVDAVLEMSGAPIAIHEGFKSVRKGGTFVAFGLPSKPVAVDMAEEIIFKGITVKAINGRKMFDTWIRVQNLLTSGRVDLGPIMTHTFHMSQLDEAMDLLIGKEAKAGKIILKP